MYYKLSPYEAMFGTDMKVGLTTHFPSESVDKINTEDDLEIFLNNINVEEDANAKNNIQVVNENYCSEASKDEGLCDLISIRQKSIDNNRKNSEICLINQAKKMKFRSIHKFPPANVGDSVRVTTRCRQRTSRPKKCFICSCGY
ncbi:KRAB-A domain-containing protein 2-like [Aphis craccivora]|uniref:KRAB-A domain-containing protein 2-like n=1 Tax=Aphis craccivora TaxID=307492 RepID=A0A6G0W3I6_APHCR|nr:KRAB-A domain-containing protein 2-like [Aphis craccivora]